MDRLEKLVKLFETDIDKFIEYHNELGLTFIKKDREQKIKDDWQEMKQKLTYPDTYLWFKVQLGKNFVKNGVEQ